MNVVVRVISWDNFLTRAYLFMHTVSSHILSQKLGSGSLRNRRSCHQSEKLGRGRKRSLPGLLSLTRPPARVWVRLVCIIKQQYAPIWKFCRDNFRTGFSWVRVRISYIQKIFLCIIKYAPIQKITTNVPINHESLNVCLKSKTIVFTQ